VSSAFVVPKTEHRAEVLDGLRAACREVAVEHAQAILEGPEPPLDVVALPAREYDVLQPEAAGGPAVPGTTVGGHDRLAFTESETVFQEPQHIDGFPVLRDLNPNDFSIFWVYCRENEDPGIPRADLRLVDDEATPFPRSEEALLDALSEPLEPLPYRYMRHVHI